MWFLKQKGRVWHRCRFGQSEEPNSFLGGVNEPYKNLAESTDVKSFRHDKRSKNKNILMCVGEYMYVGNVRKMNPEAWHAMEVPFSLSSSSLYLSSKSKHGPNPSNCRFLFESLDLNALLHGKFPLFRSTFFFPGPIRRNIFRPFTRLLFPNLQPIFRGGKIDGITNVKHGRA